MSRKGEIVGGDPRNAHPRSRLSVRGYSQATRSESLFSPTGSEASCSYTACASGYGLDDDLHQVRQIEWMGFALDEWAKARGVPLAYARALRRFLQRRCSGRNPGLSPEGPRPSIPLPW
jgi:hypothetical protein